MNKDKAVNVIILTIGSFVAGMVVNEIVNYRSMNTTMSKEAIVYLAAMDYVRTLNSRD